MSDPQPPWLALTDDQLRDAVIADGERLSGHVGQPSVGLERGLFEVNALTVQRVFGVGIRPIARHADPRVATGLYLRLHAIIAGVDYRATARAAQGHVTVSSATGGTMPAGTTILAGGQTYETNERLRLTAGEAMTVAVTASVAGAAGNVASGTAASFDGTPEPADSTVALLAGWITVPGYDADDVNDDVLVERFRPRVLAGYQVKGEANTLARYRLVALGVNPGPGRYVTSVASGRAQRGYGSADISALVNGRLPTDDEIQLVQAEIANAGIGGRDVRAAAPRVVSVAVTVKIEGSATLTAVEDAIDAWWRANIGIKDGLLVQTLYSSAHASVAGVDSIVYKSPADNIAARANTWLSPSITVTRA